MEVAYVTHVAAKYLLLFGKMRGDLHTHLLHVHPDFSKGRAIEAKHVGNMVALSVTRSNS